MKFYAITVTAYLEDAGEDAVDVRLTADLELDGNPSAARLARAVLPTHLRKVADDLEAEPND